MQTLSYKTDSDVVKTEGPNRYSRDEKTLLANAAILLPGVLLGTVTASTKVKPWAPGASDGSEVPSDVLLETVPATTVERRIVTLARHAEVVLQALVRPAGVTDVQWAAALATLEDKYGIVARNGV